MPENLRVGTVFKWLDFPHPDDKHIKDRFFLYLGETGYGESPVLIYICTTTTRFEHYEAGAARSRNQIHRFESGAYGFEQECILDLERVRSFTEDDLEGQRIEILGSLPHHELRQIYLKIVDCRKIYNKVKKDIFFAFRKAGVSGLKPPRR